MDAIGPVNANDMTFAFLILPPIIAVINQKTWSREVRGLVALGVCLLYSTLIAVLVADLDWHQWRNVVLQVLVVTFAAHKLFWQPSHLTGKIEDATQLTHPKPPDSEANPADESPEQYDTGPPKVAPPP